MLTYKILVEDSDYPIVLAILKATSHAEAEDMYKTLAGVKSGIVAVLGEVNAA